MAAPGDDGPRSPDGEPPTPEWDAVKERPWDMDAWVALIQPLEKAGAILGSSYAARDELRRAYEGILQVRVWGSGFRVQGVGFRLICCARRAAAGVRGDLHVCVCVSCVCVFVTVRTHIHTHTELSAVLRLLGQAGAPGANCRRAVSCRVRLRARP